MNRHEKFRFYLVAPYLVKLKDCPVKTDHEIIQTVFETLLLAASS